MVVQWKIHRTKIQWKSINCFHNISLTKDFIMQTLSRFIKMQTIEADIQVLEKDEYML